MDVIVDRCARLDVHKKTVMATVRFPDGRGGRAQETRQFATFTGRLVELRDWLVAEGVAVVAIGVHSRQHLQDAERIEERSDAEHVRRRELDSASTR